jgi:hypothetical protein
MTKRDKLDRHPRKSSECRVSSERTAEVSGVGAMRSKAIRAGRDRRRVFTRVSLLVGVVLLLSACAATEPAPAPSAFDRAWSAAVGAAQDEGVQIISEDRAGGVIRGIRGEQQVTIDVRTQADGNVRVEISARGPKGSDPGLAGRISRAYDRRMGR